MKLQTKKLSRFIAKWCEENGFYVSIRYGADFAYYYRNDIVRYSFVTCKLQDELMKEFWALNGLEYNCDIFLMSLLHEIGHYMTEDEWSAEESNNFTEMKKDLDGNTREGNFAYWNVPDEYRATEWAIDFINNNPEKCKVFWTECRKRIMDIYVEAGLDRKYTALLL